QSRLSRLKRFRQPEVGYLERVVLGDKAIPRLDITMNLDALGRRVIHAVTELNREAKHLRQVLREARRADPAAQIAAADEFQEQIWLFQNRLDKFRSRDVLVHVQVDPRESFLGKIGDPVRTV